METKQLKHLQVIRELRTQKIRQSIHEAIKSLCAETIKPTRYQIHKRTGISYITLKKYLDEVINEFRA